MIDTAAVTVTRRIHTPPHIREYVRQQRFSNPWGKGEKSPKIPQIINQLAEEGENIWLEAGAKNLLKTERPNKQDLVKIHIEFNERLADYARQANEGIVEKDSERHIGIEDVYINFLILAYDAKKLM
jgi:hypothetical protein